MADEPVTLPLEAAMADESVTLPPEPAMVGTSWTEMLTTFEVGFAPEMVSISTETYGHPNGQDGSAGGRPHARPRTATLLQPGISSASGTRNDAPGERKGSEHEHEPGAFGQSPARMPEARKTRWEGSLPSAQEILASAAVRSVPALAPAPAPGKPARKIREDQDAPTQSREPDQWLAPLWLAAPFTTLFVLGLGLLGTFLSLGWAGDALNTSTVSLRLLAWVENPGRDKPLPPGAVPPQPAWWRTSALHLAQWGVYLGRSRMEDGRAGESRELLEAAALVTPLHPLARLARAQSEMVSGRSAAPVPALGLSRDAVSLAWSARALRLAGRRAAALGLYQHALSVACSQAVAPSFKPDYNEAADSGRDRPGTRRYFLPGESVSRVVLHELINETGWSFEEWPQALPADPVATLAAARLLHEQDRPEARELLERIVQQDPGQGIEVPRAARAVRYAVTAEAHALLGHWKEADQSYRQAIETVANGTVRRSWWFNLASLAMEQGDEAERKVATDAALQASVDDDISRRALDLQRVIEPLGHLRPGGARAN